MLLRSRLLCLLAAPFFVSLACANERADAWNVVLRSLVWEKGWYGRVYGEKCLERIAGKKTRMFVLVQEREQMLGYSCTTRAPIRVKTTSFIAHIDGTNIVFGGTLSPFAEASIVAAGSETTCAVDEDDVVRQVKEIKKGKAFPVRVPDISARGTKADNATRDMDDFIRRSFSLGSAYKPIAGRLRVGLWQAGDPFLIVSEESGQNIQLLRAPPTKMTVNGDYCGLTFAPDPYAGPDENAKVRRRQAVEYLRDRLLEASRLLP